MKKLLGGLLVSMGLVSGLHSAACPPVANEMVLVQLQALKADGSEYRLPVKQYSQIQLQRFNLLAHLFEDIEENSQAIPVSLQGATTGDFDLLMAMAYRDVRPLSLCQEEYLTCLLADFDRVLAVYKLAIHLDPKDKKVLYPFVMALMKHIGAVSGDVVNLSFKDRMLAFLGRKDGDDNLRYALLKQHFNNVQIIFLVDTFAALVADQEYQDSFVDIQKNIQTFLRTPYLVGTLTNQTAQQLVDGIKRRAIRISDKERFIDRIESYIPGLVENYPAVPYAQSVDLIVNGQGMTMQKPGPERFPLSVGDLFAAGKVDPRLIAKLYPTREVFSVIDQGITSLDGFQDINLARVSQVVFDSNYISTLPRDMFKGCRKVELLSFNKNRLRELKKDVFHDLMELKDLNLEYNEIHTLEAGVFDRLHELRYLDLGNNEIHTLEAGVFNGLHELRHLDLGNNEIHTLEAGVFDRLNELQFLTLTGNRLKITAQELCQQNGNIWSCENIIALGNQRP